MPVPRYLQMCLSVTCAYHVVSRCVRRGFLFGKHGGKDYSHRRDWVVAMLTKLEAVFAIDVAAYAIMSNHYHLVLIVRPEIAESWSDREVVERWRRLCKGDVLGKRFIKGKPLSDDEQKILNKRIADWRKRLANISWFMSRLNETLARMANKEDGCTGRFWEGRFKSYGIITEGGFAGTMSYVDLNPIRAGMAKSIEDSRYTSVHQRFMEKRGKRLTFKIDDEVVEAPRLVPLGDENESIPMVMTEEQYLELVDETGRCIYPDKKGYIKPSQPKILEQLKAYRITPENWVELCKNMEGVFRQFVGDYDSIKEASATLKTKSLHGLRAARKFFSSG